MTGRMTILWIGLAVLVGIALFQVKYEVQSLEDELRQLNADILHEQEQIHVLRAEWAHLNRPQRLEALAARYLDLVPMKPVRNLPTAGGPGILGAASGNLAGASVTDIISRLPMRPPGHHPESADPAAGSQVPWNTVASAPTRAMIDVTTLREGGR